MHRLRQSGRPTVVVPQNLIPAAASESTTTGETSESVPTWAIVVLVIIVVAAVAGLTVLLMRCAKDRPTPAA